MALRRYINTADILFLPPVYIQFRTRHLCAYNHQHPPNHTYSGIPAKGPYAYEEFLEYRS